MASKLFDLKNNRTTQNILFFLFILLCQSYRIAIIKNDTFYNPDEFEWLYCVQKSNINWHISTGFNSHTSGPVAIWILQCFFKLLGDLSIENLHRIKIIFESISLLSFLIIYRNSNIKKAFAIALFFLLTTTDLLDFKAYNTECMLLAILPFSILLRNTKTSLGILCESAIIFILPFVKLQFAPIAAVLFILQLHKLWQLSNSKRLIALSSYLILMILPFFIFSKVELTDFFFNYVSISSWYIKHYSHDSFFYAVCHFGYTLVVHLYYLFILLLVGFYALTKNAKLFLLEKNYSHFINFLMLIAAFFCVMIPRNNFPHYYVILLMPSIFFITDILYEKMRRLIFQFLIPAILIFTLINAHYSSDAACWTKTKTLNVDASQFNSLTNRKVPNTNLLDAIILHSFVNKQKKTRLLVTGWFDAQPIYYRYRNLTTPIYRSNHTFYLSLLQNDVLLKEYHQLDTDFHRYGYPDIIVITKKCKINFNQFLNLLARDYYKYGLENGYEIFLKKDFRYF